MLKQSYIKQFSLAQHTFSTIWPIDIEPHQVQPLRETSELGSDDNQHSLKL